MRVEVDREEPAPPPVNEVRLILTEDEAVTLAALLGNRPFGRRTQPLYDGLYEAGFGYGHPAYSDRARDLR